jgi:hypothetical protein
MHLRSYWLLVPSNACPYNASIYSKESNCTFLLKKTASFQSLFWTIYASRSLSVFIMERIITTVLIIAMSICTIILAQTPSVAVGPPQCLVNCIRLRCSLDDLACICANAELFTCVQSSCDAVDEASANTILSQKCRMLLISHLN